MSRLAEHFIAGILRHAAAICAVIAPTVNSYKRLVAQGSMSGFTWAPVFVCYGNNNRTNMLRIPSPGGRVECRAADISCNPYLGGAMILAAGLEGIREQLDPGDPNLVNAYTLTPEQLAERGITMLPRTSGKRSRHLPPIPFPEGYSVMHYSTRLWPTKGRSGSLTTAQFLTGS